MNLQSCIKVAHERCETPERTIDILERIIGQRHDYWIHEETITDTLHWSALFIEGMDFRAMGKGITPALSRAGALAEAAEWLATLEVADLPGYVAADQDQLQDPLRLEDLLSHVSSADSAVIERIKELDAAKHWVDGRSLFGDGVVKLPIEYIRRISGPNGKAAGNRIEEALVHALNEVFERRAHIAVLKNRMVVPTIDQQTIKDPVVRAQLDFVREKGIEVILKDLSLGGALPCIGAYFCDPNIPGTHQFHHFFKVGSSFASDNALVRVFTEYVQGRRIDEFVEAGSIADSDRVLKHDFRALRTQPGECDNFMSSFMFGFVPLARADFLREGEVIPYRRTGGYADCLEDIGRAGEILESLGLCCYVVDWTDPAIGFPVVQAIVPGYSDVLPFHPASSQVLFREWTRTDVLRSYSLNGKVRQKETGNE